MLKLISACILANQIMAEGGPVKWLTPDNF